MQRITTQGFHFFEGDAKWLARGITYGPFEPDADGFRYPGAERVREDMAGIAAAGANCIRLYDLPSEVLVQIAAEHGLRLLVDLPWPKHQDVYQDKTLRERSLQMVREGIERVRQWTNVLGVFIANEIPPDVVRWDGAARVEKLLGEMYHLAKHVAPEVNVGYANFPSTEYLDLGFFDFVGYNVYLNDPEVFRTYMVRLRHLFPDKPVLLSECGYNSSSPMRAGLRVLVGSLSSAYECGLAGAFVFAWTDEWHTGGHEVTEWAFGLVDRERKPKATLAAVSQVFTLAPQCSTGPPEKISVVIATYNGARTLRECLVSLKALRISDIEIIVVDDGSTDSTQEILRDFEGLHVITQENRGLSAARNAGIEAATGSIVAFTDSDCIADPDWLYHLVSYMNRYIVDGVGGPNLTPPNDAVIHRVVGLAPGHATHVLVNHDEAEHVPGCNMAFRRHALQRVGGFDVLFRKAGDDVDVIWRMQDAGLRIGFSTGAFVWHHRRPTIGGYLRQQRGYGEADALLMRKHPHRFNERGQSVWRGAIYPSPEGKPLFGRSSVRYGVFGTGGYQCVYARFAGTWPFFLTSLEWWLGCCLLALAGVWVPLGWELALAAAIISLTVTGIRSWQSWPVGRRELPSYALFLVWFLWLLQPIARGGARYYHWLRTSRLSGISPYPTSAQPRRSWPRVMEFWSETGVWRVWVMDEVGRRMTDRKWLFSHNDEWEPWDLSVPVSWWFKVRLTSAEENHGGNKRLLRVRCDIVPTSLLLLALAICVAVSVLIALHNTVWARWLVASQLALFLIVYRNADLGRTKIQELVEEVAHGFGGYWRIRNSDGNVATERHPEQLTSSLAADAGNMD